MEQNQPILTKKVLNLLRVIFFTLKKSITKTRLLADINMMIKRGKITGKSLNNLLFHHHKAATTFHHHPHHLPFTTPPPTDDEFSCTTTPQHPYHIDEIIIDPVVIKAVERLTSPVGKQLRITDSPFPLTKGDGDDQVDEDAEKFILRFYNGLKRED